METKVKFIASQARTVYQYKKLRLKILKCIADIHFNKQCLAKNLTPCYADIKIPHTSQAALITKRKIGHIRVKDEIKFLYTKKDKLNKQLYQTHLKAAQEWGNYWNIIRYSIHKENQVELLKKVSDGCLHITTIVYTTGWKPKLN
jgi:hypothetical protein